MGRIEVKVPGYRCERCGHEWVPRTGAVPRVCPKCKSAYWDVPKMAAERVRQLPGKVQVESRTTVSHPSPLPVKEVSYVKDEYSQE